MIINGEWYHHECDLIVSCQFATLYRGRAIIKTWFVWELKEIVFDTDNVANIYFDLLERFPKHDLTHWEKRVILGDFLNPLH